MILDVLKFIYTVILITLLLACMGSVYMLPLEIKRKHVLKKHYILLTITSALVIGYGMIFV